MLKLTVLALILVAVAATTHAARFVQPLTCRPQR
ncbi:MAG: hypothetical protein ACI8QT_001862 [Halioglobus sp.]|jgi:hypothetical protein